MDIVEINSIVKGKKCFRAWDGAWPAMFFELGEINDIENNRGEISVCIMGVEWQIYKGDEIIKESHQTPVGWKETLNKFEGACISQVTLNYESAKFVDKMVFDNGYWIKILYSSPSDSWSIITSDRVIAFNSGGRVSIETKE